MFRAQKVVAALPATLDPSTLYFVRTGVGFDLYLSDFTGGAAHRLNKEDVSPIFPDTCVSGLTEGPTRNSAFSFCGYSQGLLIAPHKTPVDPTRVYTLSLAVRQGAAAGDWSGFPNQDRHIQSVGLVFFDQDGLRIDPEHHMRWGGGTNNDSLTTLRKPLAPGDTDIKVQNAQKWNKSAEAPEFLGAAIFGYKNAAGEQYAHYSRLVAFDLFTPAGVKRKRIELKAPFPQALANPDSPDGIWPVGTNIANSSANVPLPWNPAPAYIVPELAAMYPLLLAAETLPSRETWYRATVNIGGTDISGSATPNNFPPGTAFASLAIAPNLSNRVGGVAGFPDTGAHHAVHFADPKLEINPLGIAQDATFGSNTVLGPSVDAPSAALVLAADRRRMDPLPELF